MSNAIHNHSRFVTSWTFFKLFLMNRVFETPSVFNFRTFAIIEYGKLFETPAANVRQSLCTCGNEIETH